ncbi:hypothetical protein OXX59_007943 [Metschnikowia pulcherrima]
MVSCPQKFTDSNSDERLVYPIPAIRGKVTVADESLAAFNDLKLGKKSKFIIFALNAEKTQIVVDKTSSDDDYESFLAELPEDECKYAVYDFEYEIGGGEGKRTKIVFYTWSPDTAPVRSKMVYASSKDALRRALNGIAADIQGTDFSEVAYDSVLERVSRGAGSH